MEILSTYDMVRWSKTGDKWKDSGNDF